MIIYVFDVDGVLTDTGHNIDVEFKHWFVEWSKHNQYALATGSTFDRTLEQVGEEIVSGALLVANCMGNSIYQEGRTTYVNEFKFTDEEEQFLLDKVENSLFTERASNHIVQRPGSVNFSVLGRNCNMTQREVYKKFDMEHNERLTIAQQFKQRFPRFDVFIGGDISIDICLAGANKSQVATFCSDHRPESSLYFFGDKINEWGIDLPLANEIRKNSSGRVFHITNGYHQTKNVLTLISNSKLLNNNHE